MTLKALGSSTRGVGKTDRAQGLTFDRYGTGIAYGLNGLYNAPNSQ